jgi:hypothetical protein
LVTGVYSSSRSVAAFVQDRLRIALMISAAMLMLPAPMRAEPIPVELRQTEEGWQLFRDGEPYFIRGAGGQRYLQQLVKAGGNSIRTWGADDIDALLDEADELGLSVTVGIWLGHERHGFDYADEDQVRAQFERARAIVQRYRDHPALLLWGIGNEMEGFESGDNPAIWKAVNDVAAMVKELDPLHPTMTVTAEIGGKRVKSVHELCPACDIHGINAYGGGPTLAERYRQAGGTKPIVLTEFGPPGAWEIAQSEWGAPYELTSAEKAAFYRRTYENSVTGAPGLALGSYAFIWGYKMEATGTWFGMFLPDGSRLAAVDTMTELWSGQPPANRAPAIESFTLEGKPEVDPGDEVRVRAEVVDPEGGKLKASWALRPESGDYETGGDYRPMLPDMEGAVLESRVDGARVRMPEQPGPYRIYLYAYDDAGNAATANLPLLIKGERRTPLPFYVYQDGFEGMPWVPSGWMGAIDELTLEGDHTDNPQAGKAAIKMRYTGEFGWVSVGWQHPANNWGDQEGGFDLTGAKELELWARGEYGGEQINIGVGLIGDDKPHADSARKSVDGIVLTDQWQRYRIPLKRLDLSSIKTGFFITIVGRRTPVTVYLDSIRYIR